MQFFVLPFLLALLLAIPLLWVRLEGMDPRDIAVRNASLEERDFSYSDDTNWPTGPDRNRQAELPAEPAGSVLPVGRSGGLPKADRSKPDLP
jgi:hypothetical protein